MIVGARAFCNFEKSEMVKLLAQQMYESFKIDNNNPRVCTSNFVSNRMRPKARA